MEKAIVDKFLDKFVKLEKTTVTKPRYYKIYVFAVRPGFSI